jgi:hypothetical protein
MANRSGSVGNLAGGVSLQAKQGVVPAHALSVVRHTDQFPAALFDFHENPAAAGIDGIFHQFLDHRCRAFHHLSPAAILLDRISGRILICDMGCYWAISLKLRAKYSASIGVRLNFRPAASISCCRLLG